MIDTAKAANLYASYPADFLSYVNPPVGDGTPVPGPLKPHIACPTTSGTGSEVTGIAIFDLLSMAAKTGIASPALRPTEALVDPDCTDTLPSQVVACSGLDVLSHALESFTARPFVRRPAPEPAGSTADEPGRQPVERRRESGSDAVARPVSGTRGQTTPRTGKRVSRPCGPPLLRVSRSATRGCTCRTRWLTRWPGRCASFHPEGYPGSEPLVPHGMAVILNAPSVFRNIAPTNPQRHLEAAEHLGANVGDAGPEDAGTVLAEDLVRIMRAVGMPNGLSAVGYGEDDCTTLADGAWPQQRLLQNAPIESDKSVAGEDVSGRRPLLVNRRIKCLLSWAVKEMPPWRAGSTLPLRSGTPQLCTCGGSSGRSLWRSPA